MKKNLCICVFIFTATALAYNPVYADEAIKIRTKDGTVLSGVLTLPEEEVKGAVLILQGSGNVGSDGDVSSPELGFGYHGQVAKVSNQLAGKLAEVGVASLRYSKRGYHKDQTKYVQQDIFTLTEDAIAALDAMQSRFPGQKIAIAGFSEGALLAMLVAQSRNVDAEFLFAPPVRPVREIFEYQFFHWPLKKFKLLDRNRDQALDRRELSLFQTEPLPLQKFLPLIGVHKWHDLDVNPKDGKLSIEQEVLPVFKKFYEGALRILSQPPYQQWFESMEKIASIQKNFKILQMPVYVYQGLADAQLDPNWFGDDLRRGETFFSQLKAFRRYSGLGHCFSPMEGTIGQRKTSGPFSANVLVDFIQDVTAQFF